MEIVFIEHHTKFYMGTGGIACAQCTMVATQQHRASLSVELFFGGRIKDLSLYFCALGGFTLELSSFFLFSALFGTSDGVAISCSTKVVY